MAALTARFMELPVADAFLEARSRDPRLHLVLAGGGPEEPLLRRRLGADATFLGWLEGDELAVAYASADLFQFCSRTDTFGQAILEAQASGLPVVAIAEGGPMELISNGRSGLLDPAALAGAVCGLASSRAARERLARGGRAAVRARTWEASLALLAAGWRRALASGAAADARPPRRTRALPGGRRERRRVARRARDPAGGAELLTSQRLSRPAERPLLDAPTPTGRGVQVCSSAIAAAMWCWRWRRPPAPKWTSMMV